MEISEYLLDSRLTSTCHLARSLDARGQAAVRWISRHQCSQRPEYLGINPSKKSVIIWACCEFQCINDSQFLIEQLSHALLGLPKLGKGTRRAGQSDFLGLLDLSQHLLSKVPRQVLLTKTLLNMLVLQGGRAVFGSQGRNEKRDQLCQLSQIWLNFKFALVGYIYHCP